MNSEKYRRLFSGLANTMFNFFGNEVASAKINMTVRMIKKLLLKTEPKPVMVVLARFSMVVGEKFPKTLARSNSKFK